MKAKEIIKQVMTEKEITQVMITDMMHMNSQSAVSGALNRDMKISTLNRFLAALDCKLVIKDTKTGNEFKVED